MIKCISNDFKKLLKYFKGTAIFTFCNTSSAAGFPKIFDLYLKGDELFKEALPVFPALFIRDSSLLDCHIIPDVSE